MWKVLAGLMLVSVDLLAIDIAGGNVSGNWTRANSPYYINGDINVLVDNNLTIESGTEIVFKGHYYFNVSGTVKINGAKTDSVRISSDLSAGWRGLRLNPPSMVNEDSVIINYTSIKGVRLQNYADPDKYGGGVYIQGRNKVRISNSLITDNRKARGAGIYVKSSTVKIINNEIANNKAEADGGAGICLLNGSGLIAGNKIIGNQTMNYGGGLFVQSCNQELKVLDNLIQSNSAFFGGGIYSLNSSAYYETNQIKSNNANSTNAGEFSGGGVLLKEDNNSNVPSNFVKNVITGNTSVTEGGGISLVYANANFIGNLINANSAASKGGGIYFHVGLSDKVKLINNTITSNTANVSGGAIHFRRGADFDMKNCVVYGNNSPNGSQFYFAANSGSNTNILSASYSDVQNGQNGFAYDSGITFNGNYTNNIDADPLFTNSSNHPYSIQANSPCRNAGTSDTTGLKLPKIDIAGNNRIQDGRIDIGAYEYGTTEIIEPIQKKNLQILSSYPNPFNNQSQVCFNLNKQTSALITVFNSSGQKVKELLNSELSAGLHSVSFKADNLNTGVYFVRLQTADFSSVAKVVLTK